MTDASIVTVDSLAAAFQHFNITHVTASEFFRFIAQAGDVQPAAAKGAVIPAYDGQLSPSEIAHLTKNSPTPPLTWDPARIEANRRRLDEIMCNPALPFWLDADSRLGIIQQCKEHTRARGMQYDGPDH